MEDSLEKLNKVEHIFLTEAFEKSCAYYLAIGMTYDQFWRDDPTIAKYYMQANKIKQQITKWNNWEGGVYTYEALCKVSPVLHAFAKKGTKPLPFSEKPYGIDKFEEKEKIDKEKQIENDRMRAKLFFMNWYKATKKQFQNKGR